MSSAPMNYVACDIEPGKTLAEWRREQNAGRPRRRSLRRTAHSARVRCGHALARRPSAG